MTSKIEVSYTLKLKTRLHEKDLVTTRQGDRIKTQIFEKGVLEKWLSR